VITGSRLCLLVMGVDLFVFGCVRVNHVDVAFHDGG
jgi:hypothetical protein